ncbi:MAG: hypothetical protein GF411_12365 [Candidatus Lokiarchaeota archaeon]|nr:hypothetical protein [Candidatus Lokiarchaeota archaeon]
MISQRKTGISHWILIAKGTFVKEILIQKRYTGWLIQSLIQPIIFMVLFTQMGAGFGIGVTDSGFDFTSFLILGSVLVMLLSQMLWGSGNALRSEQYRGTLESTLMTPTKMSAMLTGYSFVDVVQSIYLIFMGLFLGVFVFGFQIQITDPVALIIALGTTMYGVMGFGFMFASVTLLMKQSGPLINIMQPILYILCGIFFPLTALPPAVQAFSMLIPLTQGFLAVQNVLLVGAGLNTIIPLILGALTGGTILALFGIVMLRRTIEHARRRGIIGAF